jgi:hypothetical protein
LQVIAYNIQTLTQTVVWVTTRTTQSSAMGGLWQCGAGPAVDGDGALLLWSCWALKLPGGAGGCVGALWQCGAGRKWRAATLAVLGQL